MEAQLLRDGFRHLASEIDSLVLEPEGRIRLVAFHDAIDTYERGFASAIDQAVADERRTVDDANAELVRVADQTRLYTFIFSGAIAAAVLLLLTLTSRRVVAGVNGLKDAIRRIAAGDLSSDARGHGKQDEFGEVAAAFADMAEVLRQRTAEVAASHEELEVANRQLAASLRAVQETQAQLVQSGKLAAVGQLAGGLAHEINNPLGVILGFAQGVQRRLQSGDPLHLPIDSIVREGLRCKSLVQELLTFSRTARKGNEPCDLNQVVSSALALVGTKARTLGVEVVQELEPDLPVIDGNPTQLQQVVVNLGTNAVDAMDGGGVLTVRTSRADGGAVAVEVIDTGCGIPPDVLARIFEPFFTTKEVGKGTGLGLSLVHEMVRQHGGEIAVDSQVGRGTRMRVCLPAAAPRTQSPAAVA
jgi:signal transduction histidine kinase